MSQAHYLRCFLGRLDVCLGYAVASITPPMVSADHPYAPDTRAVCRGCLDWLLDGCDDGLRAEPAGIAWVYDAGIPQCGIHHWPAELCEGWSHRPLIERLRATYADGRPSTRSDDPT